MGILQSLVHFDNLDGVIYNHSHYQIRYNVVGPVPKESQKDSSNLDLDLQQQKQQNVQQYEIELGGSVPPYQTKYFQFKNIQNTYKFSVFAIKINQKNQQQLIILQKDMLIKQQSTICFRIMSDLKLIHLNKQQIKQLQKKKKIQKQFLDNSSIVDHSQLTHRLFSLLPLKMESVSLLFKASQNQFNVKRFYQKYGEQQGILLICKTNKDKIIGGYTTKSFISPQSTNFDQQGWKNIPDQTKSSLIFSLSTNDIFRLKNAHNSLFYNKNQEQICFGSDQLRINNNSNINPCLTQNLNTNYQNHNYNNDIESYELLNGNKGSQFTTKQWQLWKIYLQKQAEEHKIQQNNEYQIIIDV